MWRELITEFMRRTGATQSTLAAKAKISQQVLSLTIAGKTTPGDGALVRLLRACKIDDKSVACALVAARAERDPAGGIWAMVAALVEGSSARGAATSPSEERLLVAIRSLRDPEIGIRVAVRAVECERIFEQSAPTG